MEYIPTMVTLVPGTTLFVRYLSQDMVIFLGISPTGTDSGISCSFKNCWSMNCDDSWMIRYGSGPQFFVDVAGSVLMEESMFVCLFERQEWGKVTLFEPMELKLLMLIEVVCLQFLHMICRWVALEDRMEVEMMMPEILMILATCEEFKSLSAI